MTEQWVQRIVVGLNFCPFAAKEVRLKRIRYEVIDSIAVSEWLNRLLAACVYLDAHPEVETTLLIVPEGLANFEDYLDVLYLCEQLLVERGYEGIYQLASFHPHYQFEGNTLDDAANYTNRSPFPMLHILREASIETALEYYPDPEEIPVRNAEKARGLGVSFFGKKE